MPSASPPGCHPFLMQVKGFENFQVQEKAGCLTWVKAWLPQLRQIKGVAHDFVNHELENPAVPLKPAIVVYACSGCSDAGELADLIARRLTREGVAEMSCLAGIGGRMKNLLSKAEKAERILVIDGCPLNCAAHSLRLAGFQKFEHLELQKIGIRKGSCPVTEALLSAGVRAAAEILSPRTS